jgi:hypothetical protein
MWADNPARALGQLVPDLVIAAATAGGGAAATGARRGADALDTASDMARTVNRVDDALPGARTSGSIRYADIGDNLAHDGWVVRSADNSKGYVWQGPGAPRNADMVRVMKPTDRYPDGYIVYYNSHGQPLGIDGKPAARAETHIPIRTDGTVETPKGWNE